jgi:hypothetical protein
MDYRRGCPLFTILYSLAACRIQELLEYERESPSLASYASVFTRRGDSRRNQAKRYWFEKVLYKSILSEREKSGNGVEQSSIVKEKRCFPGSVRESI